MRSPAGMGQVRSDAHAMHMDGGKWATPRKEAERYLPLTASRKLLAMATVSVLSVWLSSSVTLGQDPRISCFVFGNVHPILNPFVAYFDEDPLFTYGLEPIPSGLTDEQRRKYDRLYFPRTRKILLSYDMFFFADARIQHFSPRQWHDLEYGFRDGGVSSFYSFGPAWTQAFSGSILRPLLPTRDYDFHFHHPFRVIFRRERDPVFTPFIELGMENVAGDAYGMIYPRQGVTVWADMQPLNLPWLISWKPGGSDPGQAWVLADELNMAWWGTALASRNRNPYAIDMVINLILYSVDRPLITDIHSRRQARHLLYDYRTRKLLVLSMMEWADAFGANTLPMTEELAELDDVSVDARDRFLEQEYDAVITSMHSNLAAIDVLTGEAIRLKDEALFWVYIIEWLVVTSTGLLAGVIVWGLMIRRMMYKAARTTRTTIKTRLSL